MVFKSYAYHLIAAIPAIPAIMAGILFCVAGTGCNSGSGSSSPVAVPNAGVLSVSGCTATSNGSGWVPNVAGVSNTNHNANISENSTTVTVAAPLSGLADNVTGREVEVDFTVPTDLGLNGSFTLTAQVTNYPSGITETSFPVLTSLSDGTNEYINLPRDVGGNVDCSFYLCSANGGCTPNPSCWQVGYPSAFTDFTHYYQHQLPNWGYESVNRFPTCRWPDGNTATYDPSAPSCAFQTYAPTGHLPTGNYKAKYFLLTDKFANIPTGAGYNATLNVTITQKINTQATLGGAVDVNVVLVGSTNVNDSHTAVGQRNLDTLFTSFAQYLNVASTSIKVGNINVYELNCAQGGEALASISSNELGILLQNGSTAIGTATQGKALNIFLISEFSDSNAILGVSGAIGGPPINGLQTSGLVFATFNMLQHFNPTCSTTPCPLTAQDADFYEMGNTIAHETGHFLGLNHPSEGTGNMHDPVYDTPICTALDNLNSQHISISSCLNSDSNLFPVTGKTCGQACTTYNSATGTFCPTVQECPFNHMMWYQSKNFDSTTGTADGNMYSTDSGIIMNLSSFVQ